MTKSTPRSSQLNRLSQGDVAKNELSQPPREEVIEVERLARAERWDDLLCQLDTLGKKDPNQLFDSVGSIERGAERAHETGCSEQALALLKFAEKAYAIYASGATSGGEGIARMADVERVRTIRKSWERNQSHSR